MGRKLPLTNLTPASTTPFLAESAGGHGSILKEYPSAHSAYEPLYERVAGAGAGDRALGVVDDEPKSGPERTTQRHAGDSRARSSRSGRRLADVLMAREAQRHHESTRYGASPHALRIEQEGARAEIHLRRFA